MSDPMTNFEIEDVLSSIRRLVADHDGVAVKPASTEAPRKVGKLVLTPALRVDAKAPPAEEEPALLLREPVGDPIAPTDRNSLLATIAELEAAVREQPDDWEPDGTGTDTELSWARAGFRGDVEVEDVEYVHTPLPRRPVPDSPSAWPSTLSEAAKRYGGVDDDIDDAPRPQAAVMDEERDQGVSVPQFRHYRSENLARPAAGDEDFNDDLIGGADLGEDAEAMLDSYLADDAVIDEVLLRDMVRDIVRQELQGKLGERITRNVRKLVRREIHRVLTTQNFD